MTPDQLNAALRRNLPGLHRCARNIVNSVSMRLPDLPALPRELNGQRVWIHPRFCTTPLDVEPHVRAWLAEYLEAGSTFFDVGAYAGWHSIAAAQQVGETGNVVAFEASPSNAFYLDYHRRKNRLVQMEAVAAAVSDRDRGSLEFHLLNGGDSTSNSIQCGDAYLHSQANQPFTSITVPTTSLDAHAAHHPPDLIKIDVEGAELLVLAGARKIMTQRRPPVILAAHPAWLPDGSEPADLFRLLHEFEYEVYQIDGAVAEEIQFAEYLCLPMECGGTRSRSQTRR